MAQSASYSCEICVSAPGSHYCLECEQYFCENCKTFHLRQKLSRNHQFQSSSDVIPESKSKCKDHNEDVSFVCNTCNEVVCSSCVTGSHKGHDFSKLMDSILQLKEKNINDLRRKVQESTQNMNMMEEGINSFDRKVEGVVRAITDEGTKIKVMVDKCIAQMIASVKDQSRTEKDKLTKIIADIKMDLKTESDLEKKICELEKTRNDGKLLQSLQKLADDVVNLTIEPLPEIPYVQYTAKSATDNNIKHLFGTFKISDVRTRQTRDSKKDVIKPKSDERTRQTRNTKKEVINPKSEYEQDKETKEQGKYLYRCTTCGTDGRYKTFE